MLIEKEVTSLSGANPTIVNKEMASDSNREQSIENKLSTII